LLHPRRVRILRPRRARTNSRFYSTLSQVQHYSSLSERALTSVNRTNVLRNHSLKKEQGTLFLKAVNSELWTLKQNISKKRCSFLFNRSSLRAHIGFRVLSSQSRITQGTKAQRHNRMIVGRELEELWLISNHFGLIFILCYYRCSNKRIQIISKIVRVWFSGRVCNCEIKIRHIVAFRLLVFRVFRKKQLG